MFATDSDESSSEDELPDGERKQWGAWMFLKDTRFLLTYPTLSLDNMNSFFFDLSK